MPLFSIIVPIYNAEQHLRQCLNSIAAQTFPDFESILIDDGSTDNSASICKEIAEQDGRFIYRHKDNGGVSSARNVGLTMAKGNWISFVDADDYIMPDYLQTFLSTNPKADITFFGELSINNTYTTSTKVHSPKYCSCRMDIEQAIYELRCGKLGDVFGWTWDKFFYRDIIIQKNIRFLENVSFREDELFTLEYCRYISSLRIIDKVLYVYRIHNSGLTSRGLKSSELLPSSIELEKSIPYYSHPQLCEHLIATITDYRAKDIYASPISEISHKLHNYKNLTKRFPQSGIECKINHLTQYIRKSFWLGYIYCLLRKL